MGRMTATIAALLAVMLAWPPLAVAAEGQLDAFVGTFGGSALAKNRDSKYFGVALRASEITIAKAGDGFSITWATTKRGGASTTKSTTLTFEPAARPGVYKATTSGEPADGKPYIWASVKDRTMTLYILAVNDQGGYDLSIYERTVTDSGMDIRFRRIRDGAPMRIVSGELKRLK